MIYTDEDQEMIRYADGVFRSVSYHCSMLLKYGDRLDEIAEQLKGTVRSPAIRDPEEAKYQRGTVIYHCNIAELISEETETATKYRASESVLYELASFLQSECTPEEIEIICAYYDERLPLWLIGERVNYSKEAIRKKKNDILLRYAKVAAAIDKPVI